MGNAQNVATTSDCWSHDRKNYIGVTSHWINLDTLQREHAALACSRLFGKHTYDVLAKKIHDIHKEFKIHNKVVLTTTDSGSNFIKAFKAFGTDLNLNSLNELNIIVPTVEEEKEEEDIEYISIDNILDVALDVEDATGFQLPPHRRYITHTLNLVATTDIEKWISSNAHTSNIKTLKTIFRSCLANVQNYGLNKITQQLLPNRYMRSLRFT